MPPACRGRPGDVRRRPQPGPTRKLPSPDPTAYPGAMSEIEMVRAGFGDQSVPYVEAWEQQRRLHAARVAGEIPDTVLLLEHTAVYTAGKRTEDWERPRDGAPVVDVDRGGRITWHGPGQLVGYPIVTLPLPVDLVAYV